MGRLGKDIRKAWTHGLGNGPHGLGNEKKRNYGFQYADFYNLHYERKIQLIPVQGFYSDLHSLPVPGPTFCIRSSVSVHNTLFNTT